MTSAPTAQSVKSIGIVMLGLMGDVLMRTPLLRELRKAFPEATICCIVDAIGAEVLSMSTEVDAIYITNRSRRNLFAYVSRRLRLYYFVSSRRFDFFIDLYGGSTGRNVSWFSRSKYRCATAFDCVLANWDTTAFYGTADKFQNKCHLTNAYLRLVQLFNYPNKEFDTNPSIHLDRIQLPSSLINILGADGHTQALFLISLGAGDPEKAIPTELAKQLISYLWSRKKWRPVVISNPGQEHLQAELCHSLGQADVPFIRMPNANLREIAQVMHLVRLSIVPDSGLFHLAVGVKSPVLGIFTHTNPELVRPTHSRCVFCFREDSTKGTSAMHGLSYGTRDLTIEDAKSALDKLFIQIEE